MFLKFFSLIKKKIKKKLFKIFPFLKNDPLLNSPGPGPGQLYGLFADITLVENEQCNLTPDTCSKFDPFLSLPSRRPGTRPQDIRDRIKRSYEDFDDYESAMYLESLQDKLNDANPFRRQGEFGFSFGNPTCNRRCFRF